MPGASQGPCHHSFTHVYLHLCQGHLLTSAGYQKFCWKYKNEQPSPFLVCFPRMDTNHSCGPCAYRLEALPLVAPECLIWWPQRPEKENNGDPALRNASPASGFRNLSRTPSSQEWLLSPFTNRPGLLGSLCLGPSSTLVLLVPCPLWLF